LTSSLLDDISQVLQRLIEAAQYCAYDYQKKLQAYGLRPLMSGNGNCYDNASVETFFKTIKAELIWRQSWAGTPSG
jgi:transposase InsO family protein